MSQSSDSGSLGSFGAELERELEHQTEFRVEE
jgi:hypothetical protein